MPKQTQREFYQQLKAEAANAPAPELDQVVAEQPAPAAAAPKAKKAKAAPRAKARK